jgi:serine/threonine protein kinase
VVVVVRRFKPKHETEAEWQKEARFLLSLRHPNIIQIYDMFEHLGLYYLIVEECHGSLRQLVEQTGALPVNDVIAIAGQMLSGAPYHPPQWHSYIRAPGLTLPPGSSYLDRPAPHPLPLGTCHRTQRAPNGRCEGCNADQSRVLG